jgi:hypothetical protein
MKETGHEEVRWKLSKLGIPGLTREKQSFLRILIKNIKCGSLHRNMGLRLVCHYRHCSQLCLHYLVPHYGQLGEVPSDRCFCCWPTGKERRGRHNLGGIIQFLSHCWKEHCYRSRGRCFGWRRYVLPIFRRYGNCLSL